MTVIQMVRFFPRDLKSQFCIRVRGRGRKEREAQPWGESDRRGRAGETGGRK